jgi:hypothetical protein
VFIIFSANITVVCNTEVFCLSRGSVGFSILLESKQEPSSHSMNIGIDINIMKRRRH